MRIPRPGAASTPASGSRTTARGLLLFAKIQPFLAQNRAATAATAFRNAEWVANECPEGRPVYERISARVAKLAASRG